MAKVINFKLDELPKDSLTTFESIYNRYYPIVLRYVKYKVRRDYIAEELTNDAFISLYKHFSDYDPKKALITTWLYNIVKNIIIDHYRSMGRKKHSAFANSISTSEQMGDESVRFMILPDLGIPADSLHDSILVCQNIGQCINELKGVSKDVAIKHFYDDLSYQEIADSLSLSMSNVKVTIFRVREKLKVMLAKDYQLLCTN